MKCLTAWCPEILGPRDVLADGLVHCWRCGMSCAPRLGEGTQRFWQLSWTALPSWNVVRTLAEPFEVVEGKPRNCEEIVLPEGLAPCSGIIVEATRVPDGARARYELKCQIASTARWGPGELRLEPLDG